MQGTKSDSQIKKNVSEELKWDTRVDETEVGVQVQHGIVTLTGTVSSWAKRLAAREAAHRVAGVRDVADELTVKLYAPSRPSDTEVAEAARAALKWHSLVPQERLQTTVSEGIVTLTGEVDFASQRDDAACLVGQLEGVCAVINEIKVIQPSVGPTALRSSIEGALERHVWREAKKVKLDIDGGNITVSGDVDSLAERRAIVGAIMGTRGVEAVIDHTRIA